MSPLFLFAVIFYPPTHPIRSRIFLSRNVKTKLKFAECTIQVNIFCIIHKNFPLTPLLHWIVFVVNSEGVNGCITIRTFIADSRKQQHRFQRVITRAHQAMVSYYTIVEDSHIGAPLFYSQRNRRDVAESLVFLLRCSKNLESLICFVNNFYIPHSAAGLLFNCLFLFAIVRFTKQTFGSYKSLLIVFASYDIFSRDIAFLLETGGNFIYNCHSTLCHALMTTYHTRHESYIKNFIENLKILGFLETMKL